MPPSLPTELWQLIFKAAHSRTARYLQHNDLQAYNVEIILGLVCRFWRRVVLDTPDLWTVIALSPATSDLCLMKTYILRSAPLKISLRLDFGPEETDFTTIGNVYRTMVGRIYQLSITHPSQKYASVFLSQISGLSHPSLETIVTRSDHLTYDPQYRVIFHTAPCLTEIHMDSGPLDFLSPHTLTSLRRVFIRLQCPRLWDINRPNTFHRAFDGSSLEYLELGPTCFKFWDRSNCTNLPNLKTLVIPRMAPDLLFLFFEAIRAPDLQTVALSSSQFLLPEPWHPNIPVDTLHWAYQQFYEQVNFQVPDPFKNVFSKVRDLGFIGTPRDIPTLHAVLRHLSTIFPDLVSLHTDISVSSLYFTFATSDKLLWPDLRYIFFQQAIHTSASSAHAFALQESRAREGHPMIHIIPATAKRHTVNNSLQARANQDLRLDWWEAASVSG
ncbi:hypothetical protein FIBSPDRAFT_882968 [Athelia psychrophila]|uniref:Uncharacterized protein n=1 Tax=Athelia psychrophila TaxID=1759441 RepID=A0A166UXY5_9AGAM|nr:hypothetical protein FIBSPDRAFT_882968 [Fibularhizoctonia sp. CBS 109695]